MFYVYYSRYYSCIQSTLISIIYFYEKNHLCIIDLGAYLLVDFYNSWLVQVLVTLLHLPILYTCYEMDFIKFHK